MGGLDLEKLKEVLMLATTVVVSRRGDVNDGDGELATVDVDSLIMLDYTLAELFNLPDDDVTFENVSIIQGKLKELNK